MKVNIYCQDCGTDVQVGLTPLGFAYGTEENARKVYRFITEHHREGHYLALQPVPSDE